METLITFKTAKLAQDRKFNVECFNYYQDSHRAGIKSINSPLTNSLIDELHEEDKYCIIFYTTPSQSVLQKWLREEHNIEVWATPYLHDKKKEYNYMIVNRNVDVYDLISGDEYNTFEEAFEEGLFQALNLI